MYKAFHFHLLGLALLVGCSTLVPVTSSQIKVEATFRERLALMPGVRLEASLLDVSRPGDKAEEIGRTVIENIGQPPYRFVISYPPEQIKPSHRYAVRVVLLKDERLLFTSDQVYPVLTGGHGVDTSILLKRITTNPPSTTNH